MTEFVVGRLGNLIGAPVCEVEVVEIPGSLLPWEVRQGVQLQAGFGSATRDLSGTVAEIRTSLINPNDQGHRSDDDNAKRHGGVYALVDWCFGSDLQWLLHVSDDWRLYSHDHGWYFPPSGGDWSVDQLRATVGNIDILTDSSNGLDKDHLTSLAENLRNVSRDDIADILNRVPRAWPVTDAELQCLGWYLEERAPMVADKILAL